LQRDQYDCGLAALAMLAKSVGVSFTVQDLKNDLQINASSRPITLLELKTLAGVHGIRAVGVFVNPRLQIPASRRPWIAHLVGSVGHFVLVENWSATTVTVADPSAGRLLFDRSDFAKRWSGNALVTSIEK
jgi:ABC-type bacteriocin/lantibiotic exporter with double-glycine peptidase domain